MTGGKHWVDLWNLFQSPLRAAIFLGMYVRTSSCYKVSYAALRHGTLTSHRFRACRRKHGGEELLPLPVVQRAQQQPGPLRPHEQFQPLVHSFRIDRHAPRTEPGDRLGEQFDRLGVVVAGVDQHHIGAVQRAADLQGRPAEDRLDPAVLVPRAHRATWRDNDSVG